MIRAMAIKELRETAAAAAIALGLAMFLLVAHLAEASRQIPLLDDGYVGRWSFIFWALAIVLALHQTEWEKMRGTYHFLLHRPREWRSIFAAKIAVGLTLLQLTAALPMLCDLAWVGAAPRRAILLQAWMTEPVWRIWLSLPVVYLAAFLSGLLATRWFGTRLLPVAAASGFLVWVVFLGGRDYVGARRTN